MPESLGTYTTLKLDVEGELAILTLNPSEKRNAISPEMVLELTLSRRLKWFAACGDYHRGGKSVCAGMDWKTAQSSAEDGGRKS